METKTSDGYDKYVKFAKNTLIKCGNLVLDWYEKKSPTEKLYLNESYSAFHKEAQLSFYFILPKKENYDP